MTPADVLMLLDVLFGVRIALHPNGQQLLVSGPADTLAAAEPALRLYKSALLDHLRKVAATTPQRTAR